MTLSGLLHSIPGRAGRRIIFRASLVLHHGGKVVGQSSGALVFTGIAKRTPLMTIGIPLFLNWEMDSMLKTHYLRFFLHVCLPVFSISFYQ